MSGREREPEADAGPILRSPEQVALAMLFRLTREMPADPGMLRVQVAEVLAEFPQLPAEVIGGAIELLPMRIREELRLPFEARTNTTRASSPARPAPLAQLANLPTWSPSMAVLLRELRLVAPTDGTLLLQGPAGSGKGVVAQAVHDASLRAKRKMECVNCGAIPAPLVESLLFGAESGCATGVAAQPGAFRQANGTTLQLDEVGTASPGVQVALLRALEEGRVRPVGARTEVEVDVRVIATTNADLEQLVSRREFRFDLLTRLHVFVYSIPPLRQRREDLPALVDHLLARHGRRGSFEDILEPDAQRLILEHRWPGELRELGNAILRGVTLAQRGKIQTTHLGILRVPFATFSGNAPGPRAHQRTTIDIDRAHELYAKFRNVRAVARALAVDHNTLRRHAERAGRPFPKRFSPGHTQGCM